MSMYFFALLSFFGTVIVIPVNYTAGLDNTNLEDRNLTAERQALMSISIENVPNNSPFLKAHIFFVWWFSILVFFFVRRFYSGWIRVRMAYARKMLKLYRKRIEMRSVILTGIPRDMQNERVLRDYFEKMNVGDVEAVVMSRMWVRLRAALARRAHYLLEIEKLVAKTVGNPPKKLDLSSGKYKRNGKVHDLEDGLGQDKEPKTSMDNPQPDSPLLRSATKSPPPLLDESLTLRRPETLPKERTTTTTTLEKTSGTVNDGFFSPAPFSAFATAPRIDIALPTPSDQTQPESQSQSLPQQTSSTDDKPTQLPPTNITTEINPISPALTDASSPFSFNADSDVTSHDLAYPTVPRSLISDKTAPHNDDDDDIDHQIDLILNGHERPYHRSGFMGIMGPKVDTLKELFRKYRSWDKKVEELRLKPFASGPSAVAFVTFKDPRAAAFASQSVLSAQAYTLLTQMAPEPRDIFWANISSPVAHPYIKLFRSVLVRVGLFFLVILWSVPIIAFAGLNSLDKLTALIPELKGFLEGLTEVQQGIIIGILPTVLTGIWMSLLPVVLQFITHIEGLEAISWIEMSVMAKYFFYQALNVLIVFAITDSLTTAAGLESNLQKLLSSPLDLITELGKNLSSSGPFFINYITLQGFLLRPLELLQIGPLLLRLFWRLTPFCASPRDYSDSCSPEMISMNYGWLYPFPILVWCIGLVYSNMHPLILPFATMYFAISYFVYKYLICYVHTPRYETGGQYAVKAANRIIFGLGLYQATMLGTLGVRDELYAVFPIILPLFLLTIVFYVWIRRGFKPLEGVWPLEVISEILDEVKKETVIRNPEEVSSEEEVVPIEDLVHTAQALSQPSSVSTTPVRLSEDDHDDEDGKEDTEEARLVPMTMDPYDVEVEAELAKESSLEDITQMDNRKGKEKDVDDNISDDEEIQKLDEAMIKKLRRPSGTLSIDTRLLHHRAENQPPHKRTFPIASGNTAPESTPVGDARTTQLVSILRSKTKRPPQTGGGNSSTGPLSSVAFKPDSVVIETHQQSPPPSDTIWECDKYTTYLEPPMTRIMGVLDPSPDVIEAHLHNTQSSRGELADDLQVRSYLHPALVGKLPQIWCPGESTEALAIRKKEQRRQKRVWKSLNKAVRMQHRQVPNESLRAGMATGSAASSAGAMLPSATLSDSLPPSTGRSTTKRTPLAAPDTPRDQGVMGRVVSNGFKRVVKFLDDLSTGL